MKRWIPWVIGIGITLLLVTGYRTSSHVLDRLEALFQDAHFQWRGPIPAGSDVVIVAVDEKSIDELGRWPWPRRTIARLVDKLVEYEVKVIGFDMVFSSPQKNSGKGYLERAREQLKSRSADPESIDRVFDPLIRDADDDALLARSLRRSERSVLGYFFHFNERDWAHLSQATRRKGLKSIKSSRFNGFLRSENAPELTEVGFKEAFAVESNLPLFSTKDFKFGFFNYDPKSDGTLRTVPAIVHVHDRATNRDFYFPHLSIRVLEQYLKGTLLLRVGDLGAEKLIVDGETVLEIPVSSKGELGVNFLGRTPVFPHLSITDILHDRLDRFSPEDLKGKIVLVGATATALNDDKTSPFDPKVPGVEIHGTLIDNMLHQQLLKQPGLIQEIDSLYLLLMGVFLTAVYSRTKPARGILFLGLVAGGQFLFHHWIFIHERFWLTNVYPFLQNLLIFSGLTLHEYMKEKQARHVIKDVFGKYMSPRVVEKLLVSPGELKLGGEQKELTAFFTDLAGFTTFAEKLSATELFNHLNEYLSEMTDILLRHEGTLDKYDGDAIKAFFGAPLDFKDHARRACWVAVEMQQKLEELGEKWAQEKKPELQMRVGINTGMMVVGNIGSEKRMSYGMNGDSVNLAARLEGINKEYGTQIMISESTYLQAREDIEAREVDCIRVVGRATPEKIYELLGKKGEVDLTLQNILPIYERGLEDYRTGRWEEAVTQFQEVLRVRPEDGPSKALLERCRYLLQNHDMKADWDGVYSIQSK